MVTMRGRVRAHALYQETPRIRTRKTHTTYETQDILVLPRGPAVGACSLHSWVPPFAAAAAAAVAAAAAAVAAAAAAAAAAVQWG